MTVKHRVRVSLSVSPETVRRLEAIRVATGAPWSRAIDLAVERYAATVLADREQSADGETFPAPGLGE